ncbi:MAG TPA: UvrD-helicase domain-containing protein, partial [Patescibacteria group bacterium]|nr:UvrD-helicase domain-containing protein [Patescibacteria group bacterium]
MSFLVTLRHMSTFTLSGAPGGFGQPIDYARTLNQEQLDVVLHGDGPCLVLAGAGSGKTRTLTYRVAYLLEHGTDPGRILLLTFTNKAAREMLARVSMLLGTEAKGIWGGTFHAIGSRILRSFARDIGYTPNFSILDQDDAKQLIKAIMKELSLDPKARRFPSPAVVQDLISYARNTGFRLDEALEEKHPNFYGLAGDIEEIARQYQARKKAANVMDFDDLLSYLALLLDDPERGNLISERFQYVLVDEYQDTNTIQARIVKGFAKVHQNIVVVGDDAQSIYAFRGADVKNILAFPDQWPGAKIFRLLTNYRSTPEILDLANESLSHNVEQFKKDLVGLHQNGEKPKLVACASAAEEARYIAEQILALRA